MNFADLLRTLFGRTSSDDYFCIECTGEKLSGRFSKYRDDIKKRPDNNELAKHFNEIHDINVNLM